MNYSEREVLRVLNDPRLMSGEKARIIKQMSGTAPPRSAQAWLTSSARRARRHKAFQHAQVLRHRQIVG